MPLASQRITKQSCFLRRKGGHEDAAIDYITQTANRWTIAPNSLSAIICALSQPEDNNQLCVGFDGRWPSAKGDSVWAFRFALEIWRSVIRGSSSSASQCTCHSGIPAVII